MLLLSTPGLEGQSTGKAFIFFGGAATNDVVDLTLQAPFHSLNAHTGYRRRFLQCYVVLPSLDANNCDLHADGGQETWGGS